MPISHSAKLNRITQKAFSKIDYQAMGAAFAAHNEMGRLFDEIHYADYIEKHLRKTGHQVEREYKISLNYQDFKKDYYVDLLIDASVPYELKAVKNLNEEHRSQALNYLYLCNLAHGKLINFRKPSVEGEYISTTLEHSDRFRYSINKTDWTECSTRPILPVLEQLINEWGTYLSLEVYREGLTYFCCSKELYNKPVAMKAPLGYSGKIALTRINDSSFLYITSTRKHLNDHRKHLLNLLDMTELKQAQWINFDKNHITLRSILS